MPGKSTTWILTVLLLALLGLTAWIFWALQKVEDERGTGRHGVPSQE